MWWKSEMNFSFFLSLATSRMRSSACGMLVWLCAQGMVCWPAFPLVPALGSTGSAVAGSAADCSAAGCATLFAGFTATMAGSDFSCPCITGYGSSPSRCGPSLSRDADGQTRDLPASDAFLLHVMWPSTPAGRQHLAWRCPPSCLRANRNPRPLRYLIFRGSIPHPMQLLCTLRSRCRQRSRSTRYQAGATPYLGPDFHRLDRTSLRLAHPFDHLVGASEQHRR